MTCARCVASSIPLIFQLTSSRRGWRYISDNRIFLIYFNSHPHEEDDVGIESIFLGLAIFQLTSSRRGWRFYPCKSSKRSHISTHILTKRMTGSVVRYRLIKNDFNSHPHEEDDQHLSQSPFSYRIFQLTSSRRGWHSANVLCVAGGKISTHILTKRMTAILNKNNLFKIAYYINNKHFISIVDIFFHFHIYF